MPSTSATANAIDRNAFSAGRVRRNFQRLANGAATNTLHTSPPITGGSTIGLNVATSTGLGVVANALALLFADPTITGSSTGIKVNVIAESQVTNLVTDLASKVPSTRLVNTTAPLSGGGDLSADRTLSIPQATSIANGYLTSTDWTTFNSKQPAGSYMAGSTTLNTTTPLQGGGSISTGLTLSIALASATTNGYVTSTDWNTFNGKQPAGAYLTGLAAANNTITITAPSTIAVKLNTPDSGLGIVNGLTIGTDSSLTKSGSTLSVNLNGAGGLQVPDATGIIVKGARLLSADPGSPVNGDRWYNTTSNQFKAQMAAMIGQCPIVLVSDGKGTLVSSTTAFSPTNATASLPANFLVAGRTVRIKAWGVYNTAVTTTLVLGAFIDSANSIGDGPTISLTGVTNGRFYMEVGFTCIVAGSVNTVRSSGFIYYELGGVVTISVLGNTLSPNTANAMIAESVCKFSVANSGNTVQGYGCEISVIG